MAKVREVFFFSQNQGTWSSGLTCSEREAFRLYAAHKISRDFLSVSSILHAVKSAAAAAS